MFTTAGATSRTTGAKEIEICFLEEGTDIVSAIESEITPPIITDSIKTKFLKVNRAIKLCGPLTYPEQNIKKADYAIVGFTL
tara:strand:+ start:449 stop:694 length:246 start_codon:yes stop_codon:yes gene_type:complete